MISEAFGRSVDELRGVELRRRALVLHVTEHSVQAFLAVDHVFGAAESARGEHGALDAHASGPGIDGVLHVGELAGGDCARVNMSRCADSDGRTI